MPRYIAKDYFAEAMDAERANLHPLQMIDPHHLDKGTPHVCNGNNLIESCRKLWSQGRTSSIQEVNMDDIPCQLQKLTSVVIVNTMEHLTASDISGAYGDDEIVPSSNPGSQDLTPTDLWPSLLAPSQRTILYKEHFEPVNLEKYDSVAGSCHELVGVDDMNSFLKQVPSLSQLRGRLQPQPLDDLVNFTQLLRYEMTAADLTSAPDGRSAGGICQDTGEELFTKLLLPDEMESDDELQVTKETVSMDSDPSLSFITETLQLQPEDIIPIKDISAVMKASQAALHTTDSLIEEGLETFNSTLDAVPETIVTFTKLNSTGDEEMPDSPPHKSPAHPVPVGDEEMPDSPPHESPALCCSLLSLSDSTPWRQLQPLSIDLTCSVQMMSEAEVGKMETGIWQREKCCDERLALLPPEPLTPSPVPSSKVHLVRNELKLQPETIQNGSEMPLPWDPVSLDHCIPEEIARVDRVVPDEWKQGARDVTDSCVAEHFSGVDLKQLTHTAEDLQQNSLKTPNLGEILTCQPVMYMDPWNAFMMMREQVPPRKPSHKAPAIPKTGDDRVVGPIGSASTCTSTQQPGVMERHRKSRIIKVPLSEPYEELLQLLTSSAVGPLSLLQAHGLLPASQTFLAFTPDITRYIMKQYEKTREDTQQEDVGECYQAVVGLHLMVCSLHLMVHCGLDVAVSNLAALSHTHQTCLQGLLEPLRHKLMEKMFHHHQTRLSHPKYLALGRILSDWYTAKRSAGSSPKVLILVGRDIPMLLEEVQSTSALVHNTSSGIIHREWTSQHISTQLSDHTCMIGVVSGVQAQADFPWREFGLVVELEYRDTNTTVMQICQDKDLVHLGLLTSIDTAIQPVDQSDSSAERSQDQPTTTPAMTPVTLIASESVTSVTDLVYLLEARYNLTLVSRDYSCLASLPDAFHADLILNESCSIVLVTPQTLREDWQTRLMSLSLKYSHCWLILLSNEQEDKNRYMFGGNVISASADLQAVCLQLAEGFIAKVVYGGGVERAAGLIRQLVDHTKHSQPDPITPIMRPSEKILLTIPCINSYSAQLLLRTGSLRHLASSPLQQLRASCPRLSERTLMMLFYFLHSQGVLSLKGDTPLPATGHDELIEQPDTPDHRLLPEHDLQSQRSTSLDDYHITPECSAEDLQQTLHEPDDHLLDHTVPDLDPSQPIPNEYQMALLQTSLDPGYGVEMNESAITGFILPDKLSSPSKNTDCFTGEDGHMTERDIGKPMLAKPPYSSGKPQWRELDSRVRYVPPQQDHMATVPKYSHTKPSGYSVDKTAYYNRKQRVMDSYQGKEEHSTPRQQAPVTDQHSMFPYRNYHHSKHAKLWSHQVESDKAEPLNTDMNQSKPGQDIWFKSRLPYSAAADNMPSIQKTPVTREGTYLISTSLHNGSPHPHIEGYRGKREKAGSRTPSVVMVTPRRREVDQSAHEHRSTIKTVYSPPMDLDWDGGSVSSRHDEVHLQRHPETSGSSHDRRQQYTEPCHTQPAVSSLFPGQLYDSMAAGPIKKISLTPRKKRRLGFEKIPGAKGGQTRLVW